MDGEIDRIETALGHIVEIATDLRADPDGHVRRSVQELRDAFASRGLVEPAVARVRQSILMLRSGNRDGSRREFMARAGGLDRLDELFEAEVLPDLRRLGFEV